MFLGERHEKQLWASMYESVMEVALCEGFEGIDVNLDAGAQVLLRWGHFWPDVVRAKVDVASLVFAHTVSRGFDVEWEWGNRAPFTTYSRALDKEIFLRSHRRMLDIVSQTFWEKNHGRSDCADVSEFKLLILLLYCVYEKGDVHALVQSQLPGYEAHHVFPQWVGSLMCRRQCAYDDAVPVYRYVVGRYVERYGLQQLLVEESQRHRERSREERQSREQP